MSNLYKTCLKNGIRYEIFCSDIIGEGPLDQIYSISFEIKKADDVVFKALIKISDVLVNQYLGRIGEENERAEKVLKELRNY